MHDALQPHSDFTTHGGFQVTARLPATAHAAPPVQRPHQFAPNGRPISLASKLRYDQLLRYVAESPSGNYLEIGVARGANTLRMLAFADWLGGQPHYTGIDLFGMLTDELFDRSYCSASKRPLTTDATRAMIHTMLGPQISDRVELFEGFSYDVLPKLVAKGRKYDLIFIDGGHSEDDVQSDWRHSQQLLAAGGTIVFDDYPNWGVLPTVQSIDQRVWNVRVLPHRDTFKHHLPDADGVALHHHQLVEARRR